MEVDDRELRLGHRMLRYYKRRPRVIVADLRLRELGLAPFGRPRPDLTGRQLLRTDDAEGDDAEGEKRGSDSFHIKSVRSRPVRRILSAFAALAPGYGETGQMSSLPRRSDEVAKAGRSFL